MTNFFNNSFTFPMGMNNWFMPNWSFPNYFTNFQMMNFNIFDNWFNSSNYYPFAFQQQQYSFNYPYFNYSTNQKTALSSTDALVSKNSNTDTFTRTTKSYNDSLSNYNPYKGNRLASIALSNSVGWTGYCAAYVKNSIQAANLGSYKLGHAYQMSSILENNSNFEEISPDDVDVKELPAGCVLVYDKGVEGYSKKYGHTEITTGDGRAVSDGITKNLHKKPSAIFIPV